jgi:hypothetical protein
MYKSWIPASDAARGAFGLAQGARALLALLFARVARRFDWPVCQTDDGRVLFRYYSTYHNFRDLAIEGLWPEFERRDEDSLKTTFYSAYCHCKGELLMMCSPNRM